MKHLFRNILMLSFISLFMLACTKDEDDTPVNNAPVASFTINPGSGNVQTEFNLDASASSDTETPADQLMVRWDANDDGTWESDYSTNKLATLTYEQAGTYTIRLEVKDGGGATASTTKEVTVGNNLSPEAPANPNPANGAENIPVIQSLQWTASDPDQDPLSFDVYFGNAANPPMVAEGIDENSYDPGIMAYSTTYYWKIIAHDDNGNTTEGPVWSFTTEAMAFSCGDVITDARNGETYPTVEIGEQCWMAKNLNIGDRIDGATEMTDNDVIEKYCYDNEEANCDNFGGLYQWGEIVEYEASNTTGICPSGWHVPTIEEWQELEIELGMSIQEATASTGWQGTDEGDKLKEGGSSGFDALMSGQRRSTGGFQLNNFSTAFWSSSQASTYIAKARSLDQDHSQVNHTNYDKKYGHAVRCVKD